MGVGENFQTNQVEEVEIQDDVYDHISLKARTVLSLKGKFNIPDPTLNEKVEKRPIRKTPEGHFYEGEWSVKTGL